MVLLVSSVEYRAPAWWSVRWSAAECNTEMKVVSKFKTLVLDQDFSLPVRSESVFRHVGLAQDRWSRRCRSEAHICSNEGVAPVCRVEGEEQKNGGGLIIILPLGQNLQSFLLIKETEECLGRGLHDKPAPVHLKYKVSFYSSCISHTTELSHYS